MVGDATVATADSDQPYLSSDGLSRSNRNERSSVSGTSSRPCLRYIPGRCESIARARRRCQEKLKKKTHHQIAVNKMMSCVPLSFERTRLTSQLIAAAINAESMRAAEPTHQLGQRERRTGMLKTELFFLCNINSRIGSKRTGITHAWSKEVEEKTVDSTDGWELQQSFAIDFYLFD